MKMRTYPSRARWMKLASMFLVLVLGLSRLVAGQQFTVTGQAELITKKGRLSRNRSSIVIWLNPIGDSAGPLVMRQPAQTPRLIQKSKRFEPHILVVPVGTAVEFPNRDPFFHNVFSLFEGKRFDLGLYEAGTTRTVRFDHPGVSYIFCNIHPEMSAAVIALKTPYYAVSDAAGSLTVADVPAGRYQMQVWYEGSSPQTLKKLTREITISASEPGLGAVRVLEDVPVSNHKNKYGRDYDTPTTKNSEYGPN